MKSSFHNLNTKSKATSYSYRYADEVVNSFIDKRGRTTYFLAKMLGIEPKEFVYGLKKLFMWQNGRWNAVRDTIKYVDNHNLYEMIAKLDYENRLIYLTKVKNFVEDFIISGEKIPRGGLHG